MGGKLREVGVRNLVIGLTGLFVLAGGLRYWFGTVFVYENRKLFDVMYDETAATLRLYNVLPGMLLPVLFFLWMYLGYVNAVKGVDYGVASREKIHAVLPGIVLAAAEAALVFAMTFPAAGCLGDGEQIYRNMILGAYVTAGIVSAASELALYVLACFLLKPDRLMGKG